jgi:cell surface protein SprA
LRASEVIQILALGSATIGLLGTFRQVAKNASSESVKDVIYIQENNFRVNPPPDTPDNKPILVYPFKDSPANNPPQQNNSLLYLQDPSNIKQEFEYDPKEKIYNIKYKVGDMDYRPESYMSFKEYENYVFKKSLRNYWRSRVAADEMNNQPKKGMIPTLQVNSELFDRIFGGNTVDIRPTGTAELIFGLNRNKILNPAIPQRQQRMTNFDFNMRIQLNLLGKIGEKVRVTTNYNTEASFDWENQVKIDYTGLEDDILKKIEAGNVTLPLNSSLISGSQTLFGFKTEMQFGRLRATTVFSQQRGKKQEITVQGGAQTIPFSVNVDNYEMNRHYFLGYYFFKNYDNWMKTLPVISTPVVINKVEIWVLNQTGNNEQTRTILAFEDLGEDSSFVFRGLNAYKDGSLVVPTSYAIYDSLGDQPHNGANSLYFTVNNLFPNRDPSTIASVLATSLTASNPNNSSGQYMMQARDYDVIYNARKLNPNEYFINNRLGFISLSQTLNNDQVLAVSYQYTYNGKTYQVGEFSDQYPNNSGILICKLLKGSVVNTRYPNWKFMMKNVYSIGAYNINPQDFMLNIFYNNIETGVDIPYLPFGAINGQQLIRVLNCDNLAVNGDKVPDGVFDFIKDYTINPNNGRIYLPMVEPFGNGLKSKFDPNNDFPAANKYIFQELYDSTRTAATFIQEKNRYKIKGTYRSASGSEFSLNAINIPQGAVVVTANGVQLQENVDYTVDYNLGRVKIINEGLLNSGSQIKVSLESNSLFNVQQKSLIGTRLDYKVNRFLNVGGTFLRFNERPITQKVAIGEEPVRNTIIGLDYNFKSDVPFITRWLDKLPFYSTKEMSSITTRGEFAKLFPGNARAIGRSGNSYIDDFEGSINIIDIRNPNAWFHSSIPQGQPDLFPEAIESSNIKYGLNRAKLCWYNVDPMFTRKQGQGTTPSYYNAQIFSNNMWRQVFETELFPGKTPPNGQMVILPVLDLGFYPKERGPYNYDVLPTAYSAGMSPDGFLNNPSSRWAGISRRLETNDFQAANVEYIQFWLMDPFNEDYNTETHPDFDPNNLPVGDLYINLGNISEDIVKDGRLSYENGLPGQSPASSGLPTQTTGIAIVPSIPPSVNAFSNDNNDRPFQDVGYDGMNNEVEKALFASALNDAQSVGNLSSPAVQAFLNDPSSDDYKFFRGDDLDEKQAKTIERYAKYNNPEGNSPTEQQYQNANPNGGNYPTGATNLPNIEDLNRDNTLSETESYYQYRIRISPQDINPNNVGNNFIVDAFDGTADYDGGIKKKVKWYQFKIPVNQFEKAVNNIEGFNSIRFMRVFLKGFDRPVLLRFARFELVRSDWRRYEYDLRKPGEYIKNDDNTTTFDVSAVNLQENGNKVPVNYVMPPEIEQVQNVQTTNLVLQNEQALQVRVCNLKDGDSRAIFKNVDLDTRMFNNIKLNVHAEKLGDNPLNDGELEFFMRVGTDYNNNYYEYTVPLKLTPPGTYDPNNESDRYRVWPAENEVNFAFSEISQTKQERNEKFGYFSSLNQLAQPYTKSFGNHSITIVGNPNLGTVKAIMMGVRNPRSPDGQSKCVEVWVNELRLTDFNNRGGWAATGQVQLKMADLGNMSLAGLYSTPFFGGVEKKINERSKETNLNWDFSTSINVGKFFPQNLKITLPVYYNYGQTIITPLFNPLDPDVRMSDFNKAENITKEKRDSIRRQVIDYQERKGFNFTNVRIDGLKKKGAPPYPWDISNFSLTYAFTQTFRRNINIDSSLIKNYRGNITYQYAIPKPYTFKPFEKTKIFQNKWFTLIRDINFQLLPNAFGFSMDVNRNFSFLKNRDITGFYAGASQFQNPRLYNKNFLITRNYTFRWDFTRNIKFDYTASNESRVLEPYGDVSKRSPERRDTVIQNLLGGGTNTIFRQQMNLNVNIPINKIPLFDFVSPSYRYGGTYTWNRVPFASPDSFGNTINNTNQHNLTANLNLVQFYNKIPYFKRILSNQPQTPKPTKEAKGSSIALTDSTNPKKNENLKDLMAFLAKVVLMVKNISLNYQLQMGQTLPNFMPRTDVMGMNVSRNYAPGFLFTTGWYVPDIRERAERNNWLTRNSNQSAPYIETFQKTFSWRSSVEPHGSLRIELNGNVSRTNNLTEFMIYGHTTGRYDFHVSPSETGNFNITTFSFFKGLSDRGKGIESSLYDEFLAVRADVAKQLSDNNPNSVKGVQTVTTVLGKTYNFYDGYDFNSQDVLIGAFYQTYTGQKIRNYSTKNLFPKFPMPNWNITWDGLGKIPILQKHFRSITVRHSYRSTYNISGYNYNLLYGDRNAEQITRAPVVNPITNNANFNSFYNINAVSISEAFAPLIKFDFQFNKPGWNSNFEIKRDKTIALNITGPQIVETKGQEYVVGLGYRYPNLTFKNLYIMGKQLRSDLLVKVDVSYRRNITIIRRIADEISLPTVGANIFTLRSSADYNLTQNIILRLYFDMVRNTPQTSAAFPSSNINGGFSLRINFQ